MRKSTMFISAVLTTFVMATLAGVASAYQKMSDNNLAGTTQLQAQSQVAEVSNSIPASTEGESVNWTPEEAAALAAQVLGRDDLYSVEVSDLNGETVYLVTFSSGDLVYVSLDGQILSIGKVEVETVVINTGGGGGGRKGDGDSDSVSSNSNQSREDDHDNDHEEHEEHDD